MDALNFNSIANCEYQKKRDFNKSLFVSYDADFGHLKASLVYVAIL